MRALLALLVLATAVSAFTFVPVDDGTLADTADCVFVADVLSINDVFKKGITRASTSVRLRVSDVVKRAKSADVNGEEHLRVGEEVVVSVPGGYDPEVDLRLTVPGAPEFVTGERVLLFAHHHEIQNTTLPLLGHENGPQARHLAISHFALGAFKEHKVVGDRTRSSNPRTFAVNPAADPTSITERKVRDFSGFVEFLRSRVDASSAEVKRSSPSEVNYWDNTLSMHETEPVVSASREKRWATFNGQPRWCNFATTSTNWRHTSGGQPSYSPTAVYTGGALTELTQAMDLFNNFPGVKVAYVRYGTTTSTKGFTASDSIHGIIYNDPNSEISSPFSCSSGGTLAIGGWWSSGSCTFNSRTHAKIVEGDLIMNKGIGCSWITLLSLAELYAHELGHSLGFAHSNVANALMWPSLHNDGRGAVMDTDDEQLLTYLYQSTCVPPTCLAGDCGVKTNACGSVTCPSCSADYSCSASNRCECDALTCGTNQCGIISSSCTNKNCGTCAQEFSCIDNTCTCNAVTCAANECGLKTNSCGNSKQCGTCTSPNVCTNGVCVAPTCVPLTCASGDCGAKPDGCGGTLSCGTCGQDQTCSNFRCECNAIMCDTAECGTKANTCSSIQCGSCPTTDHTCDSNVCVCDAAECGTRVCGSVTNLCGQTMNCGSCLQDQICSASGVCECSAAVCPAGRCGTYKNACGNSAACSPCSGAQDACISGTCVCQPLTCQQGDCGQRSDGCGGTLSCGGCTSPNVCTSGRCTCVPQTCSSAGFECGTHPDLCGGQITCGPCTGTDICFQNTSCVAPGCTPATTCADAGRQCGSLSTTCTETGVATTIDCGTCSGGLTCDGTGACVCPTTLNCSSAGANCGDIDSGCGNIISCGTCTGAEICLNNSCTCAPLLTCPDTEMYCSSYPDGCGGYVSCGGCAQQHDVCVQVGNVSKCVCSPHDCAEHGYSCGSHDNGCGSPLDCGRCSNTSHYCLDNKFCMPIACTPLDTCSSVHYSCDDLRTTCNETGQDIVFNCGYCRNGQTCGDYVVVSEAGAEVGKKCTCAASKTCESERRTCGVLENGCGTFLECGECRVGLVCSGTGQCVFGQGPDAPCASVICGPGEICQFGACKCARGFKLDPLTRMCESTESVDEISAAGVLVAYTSVITMLVFLLYVGV